MTSQPNQNNICNNIAYLNSVDQKRRFQLVNIPPVRYNNFATNPYMRTNPATGLFFTKTDVDMRRKAEILKYSSNRMSTQTNNLTKAQKYVNLVNGKYQQRTYSQDYISRNLNPDIAGQLKPCIQPPTPSTACDIPGPTIYLYEDVNVPLYNYSAINTDSPYGIQNQEQNPYTNSWDYTKQKDIEQLFIDNDIGTNYEINYTTVSTLFILQNQYISYIFSVQMPIAISITGNLIPSLQESSKPYVDSRALSIIIRNVNVNVKYSYSDVQIRQTSTVFDHGPNGIPIDISINTSSTFSATVYLGMLQINELLLLTQQGYVYDIQTNIYYQINTPSGNYINFCDTPVINTYLNTSLSTVQQPSVNCTVQGGSAINPANFPTLYISGIPSS
jgi:hypothetical protein